MLISRVWQRTWTTKSLADGPKQVESRTVVCPSARMSIVIKPQWDVSAVQARTVETQFPWVMLWIITCIMSCLAGCLSYKLCVPRLYHMSMEWGGKISRGCQRWRAWLCRSRNSSPGACQTTHRARASMPIAYSERGILSRSTTSWHDKEEQRRPSVSSPVTRSRKDPKSPPSSVLPKKEMEEWQRPPRGNGQPPRRTPSSLPQNQSVLGLMTEVAKGSPIGMTSPGRA